MLGRLFKRDGRLTDNLLKVRTLDVKAEVDERKQGIVIQYRYSVQLSMLHYRR